MGGFDKSGKLLEHPLARISDHLNSNRHKLSVKTSNALKKCAIEMSMSGKWHLMHLYNPVKLSIKIIILKCFLKITFSMIRKKLSTELVPLRKKYPCI